MNEDTTPRRKQVWQAPDWPQAMRRKTAAAYLDLSERAFLREIAAGRLPAPITLGGRDHWHRPAIDRAIRTLTGVADAEEMPAARRALHKRYGIT
jgi:predicted DNA-binding transcriptional regulator AlpA